MARLTGDILHDRAKLAIDAVELNQSVLIDCEEYTNPFRNTYNKTDRNLNRNTKAFDSTAIVSRNNFVNSMVSNATPPFQRWVELTAGPAVPELYKDGRNKELEVLNDALFIFRNASNFNTVVAEMYQDVGISTGIMLVLPGDAHNPLNYVSVPTSQMGFLEGRYGNIDFYVRRNSVPARLILQYWPKAKLTEGLREIVSKPELGQKDVQLHECFYYDYQDMVWRYEVLDFKAKQAIFDSRSLTCPVITWRWSKVPGQVLGVGPVMMALSDVKTLNKMKELTLRGAALSVFGVYTVSNSSNFNPNTAVISPGGFIPVDRNGGPDGPSIQPLPAAGNFEAQEYMIKDLQEQVRQVMLDNRLQPEANVQRTAFEVSQIMKNLNVDIGAAFGRFQQEFATSLIRRELEVLDSQGMIVLPEGFAIDNFLVKVQITSPIAASQNLDDVNNFTTMFTILQMVNPQLAEVALEMAELPAWLTEKTGSAAKLIKDKEAIMQALQSMSEMAMAQQAAELMQAAGANGLQAPMTPMQ